MTSKFPITNNSNTDLLEVKGKLHSIDPLDTHKNIQADPDCFWRPMETPSRTDVRPTMLWIESGSCSGESMAILGAEGAGKAGDNLAGFLLANHVDLLWHPSISSESPREVADLLDRIAAGEQPLTLLCIEGSIIHGPGGTGMFDTFEGRPKKDLIASLCHHSEYVLAMGTCSAFGGIPAASPNPSSATGLQFTIDKPGGLLDPDWRSQSGLPVLNLAGCPVDATTMIQTMCSILDGLPLELDRYNRPHTINPCLSDPNAQRKKCGTSDQVGYACYGCIGARFPVAKALFRQTTPQNPPQQILGRVD